MVELWDPDAFVEAPPYEFLAELRRTQPVNWQDMPDQPGFVDYRRPLVPSFKAKVIGAMDGQIRTICRGILERA